MDKLSTTLSQHILLVSTITEFWIHNFIATVISTFVVHLHWKITLWFKVCWKTVVRSFAEFCKANLKLCFGKNVFTPTVITKVKQSDCDFYLMLVDHRENLCCDRPKKQFAKNVFMGVFNHHHYTKQINWGCLWAMNIKVVCMSQILF